MSNDEGLQELYPFLHGRKADARALNAALVESVRQKAQHHQNVFEAFFTKNGQSVVDAARTIAELLPPRRAAVLHGQWRLELRRRPRCR